MSPVNILIYGLYLLGIYLIFENTFTSLRKKAALRKRLSAGLGKGGKTGPFSSWIQSLLSASSGNDADAGSFITLLVFIFVFIFLLASVSLSLPAAFVSALLCAGLPVLILWVRLETVRSKGSHEGISLVTELYRQYRMKNFNIFEALQATIDGGGQYPVCRVHMYRLLLRLRSSASADETRQSIDNFAFALGTTWGRMLATCIRLAAEKGSDVSAGLSDIIDQLKTANTMAEDRKRLNSEASRMTVFLVPVLYAGTMFLGVWYLDVSPSKLMKNQFFTSEGLLFFIATVILFVFNLTVIRLVDNTRLDY